MTDTLKRRAYRNIQASLVKFCNEQIDKYGLSTFMPFNFDTHAVVNEVPEKDMIGIGELSISNNEGTYVVTCKIAVCTAADDSHLDRLNEAIDTLFHVLRPGYNELRVVDFDDGRVIGNLAVMDGVTVLPVGSTKGRPLQAIAVSFASTLIVPP